MEHTSFVMQAIIIIAFTLGLYFVLIRPQRRKLQKHTAMLSSLSVGDQIVTASGFVGTIRSVNENGSLTIELSSGVLATVMRWGVNDVLARESTSVEPASSYSRILAY